MSPYFTVPADISKMKYTSNNQTDEENVKRPFKPGYRPIYIEQ